MTETQTDSTPLFHTVVERVAIVPIPLDHPMSRHYRLWVKYERMWEGVPVYRVTDSIKILRKDGTWVRTPVASEKIKPEVIAEHYFPYDEAVALAGKAALSLEDEHGLSVSDILETTGMETAEMWSHLDGKLHARRLADELGRSA